VQPKVFLVDDDAAIRDALSLLLSLKGIPSRAYSSAEEFLREYQDDQRGCVLTDLRMPGLSGLDLHRALQQRGATLPVVVLTAYGDVGTARLALKSGAFDFLEKPVDDALLVDVLNNAISYDARVHVDAQRRSLTLERVARLTAREREVLEFLARGLQNREIAAALQISPRTVEVYKARMMEKLDCRTLADVVRIGMSLQDASASRAAGTDEPASGGPAPGD